MKPETRAELDRQMLVVRASLQAAVAGIEAAWEILLKVDHQAPQCKHEHKKSVSTMNNPDAWYCPDCKTTGGNEAEKVEPATTPQEG